MRKILIRSALVAAFIAAILALWIFRGRQIALWFDRFGTMEVRSTPVSSVIYEGSDRGGIFWIGDISLATMSPDQKNSVTIQSIEDGSFTLKKDDKVFPLGKPREANASRREFVPGSSDEAVLTIRRGLSWPTPFDFNFMSGHSPSWKRHLYYRLRWRKPNGPKLRMVWRFEQYFYKGDGWASGFMTREGSTGLIRVEIEK